MKKLFLLIVGVGAAFAFAAGAIYLIVQIVEFLGELDPNVLSGLVVAIAAVVSAIVAYISSRRSEVFEAHRSIKVDIYRNLITGLLENVERYSYEMADSKELAEDEDFKRFIFGVNRDLILWGSAKVIRSWLKFRSLDEGQNVLLLVDDLFRSIRSDLKLSNVTLRHGELIKIILRDPQEVDKLLR